MELNSHGVNRSIKAHILSDDEMKRIGFHGSYYEGTDDEMPSTYWYFIKAIPLKIGKHKFSVCFEVDIPKDGSDIDIAVLDMDFCQPYDYQHILETDPKNTCAITVKQHVEKWMKYLQDNGVLSGHTYGEYI